MFLKNKYKLIKKCEMDFWGISYLRPRKTKFFIYLKKLFTHKIKAEKRFSRRYPDIRLFFLKVVYKHEFFVRSHRNNLVLKEKNRRLLRLNYYILFGRQSVGKSLYLYRKSSRVKFFRDDLIIGINRVNPNKKLLLKRRKLFERQKLYLKQLILFYNQMNLKKLRKLGYLASKSQLGTINTFFYLLECRIDNILLRFNLGSRFFIRNFIQAGNVLLNNKLIYSINHIVKEFCYVSFNETKTKYIYKSLIKRLKYRLFFTQPPYYFEINYKILTFLIIPKFLSPFYIPYPFLKTKSLLLTGLHTVLWGW
jgi:ribosomal protein S4